MEGFTIEGWDDFVENFSKFVDKWADKKKILLQRMSKERVMDYLQDIKQDKIIIIISHDCEIAELCDKVVKI